jgi:hypothetical protein
MPSLTDTRARREDKNAQALAFVTRCPRCDGSHLDLFIHRGHQGGGTYAFCPATGQPFDLPLASGVSSPDGAGGRLTPPACADCAAGVPLNKYGIHESFTETSSVCTDPANGALHRRRDAVMAALLRQQVPFPSAGLPIVAGN